MMQSNDSNIKSKLQKLLTKHSKVRHAQLNHTHNYSKIFAISHGVVIAFAGLCLWKVRVISNFFFILALIMQRLPQSFQRINKKIKPERDVLPRILISNKLINKIFSLIQQQTN